MVKIFTGDVCGKYTVEDLLGIMEALRSPDGCPWDREQTHKTIRNDALEEAYEVADAIDNNDESALCEELGDMLLQVVFHSQIAKEDGSFTFDDVVDGICKKLVLRHPHVFGEASVSSSSEVLNLWDSIKQEEKHQATVTDTLESVPKAFPALMRAAKVHKRALKAQAVEPIQLSDAEAALQALKNAVDGGDASEAYGNFLFASAALQQSLKLNAEETLSHTTDMYIAKIKEKEQTCFD